jgi:hypothetical protein
MPAFTFTDICLFAIALSLWVMVIWGIDITA